MSKVFQKVFDLLCKVIYGHTQAELDKMVAETEAHIQLLKWKIRLTEQELRK